MLENFNQAAKEVFSLKSRRTREQAQTDEEQRGEVVQLVGASGNAKIRGLGPAGRNPSVGGAENDDFPELNSEIKTTFITEQTKIQGSIISESNVEIAGEIKGNVESKRTVIVMGKIHGNVDCKDAEFNGAHIEGDVTVVHLLEIGRDSVVVGDVTAENGRIAGKVKGTVAIKQELEIAKEALVLGDISANMVSVAKGAVIQGGMNIRSDELKFDGEVKKD